MAEFKNLARAFLPGVAGAERRLKDVEAQVEEEDLDRTHHRKVRGFERRTDEALSEGRATAAEFNLEQMKRAMEAARTGQVLSGPAAARAIPGPTGSVPMIEAPQHSLPDPAAYMEPTSDSVVPSVTDDEIVELAGRFARQAEGIDDPIERQRFYRQWSQDLRRSMPEFQAVEVERTAKAMINSFR